MVALDLGVDPTLEAADHALKEAAEPSMRGHLGISGIGGCPRKTAYSFQWVGSKPFEAKTLKLFADGHRTEPLFFERLRLVPGLTIVDFIDDKQIRVDGYKGHFVGHLDFEVLGLLQAPKTWHVGEIKTTSEKNLTAFRRLKVKHGEKNALKEWNITYYAQAQCYMRYRKRTRHWLIVGSAGGRDWDACRTEYNEQDAEAFEARAIQIIDQTKNLPDRISEDPEYFICKHMCEFAEICHGDVKPQRNCRTCVWSQPQDGGKWMCWRHDRLLSYDEQRVGCSDQRYRPSFVKGEVVQSDDETNHISYYMPDGREWIDEGT